MANDQGMRYIERVANGNAGEFYFAYWISNKFVWPCRILDIDMGLDAQVEIYDDNCHSTGMFIGVKVKTTSKKIDDSLRVSVPIKNLIYWQSINDPIVIVRVFLNDNGLPVIFWKHLGKDELAEMISISNEKKSDSYCITFDKENNLLKESDKNKWIELFLTKNDIDATEDAVFIKNKLKCIGDYLGPADDENTYQNGYPYNFANELNGLLNKYDKVISALRVNPRLIQLSSDIKSLIECYNQYINSILIAFEIGVKCHSVLKDDIDKYDQVNPRLNEIFVKY